MYRLVATGVAVAGTRVIALVSFQRQDFFHVVPGVGVFAQFARKLAGIQQVTTANVVTGQGKKGAVRLGNGIGQPAMAVREVFRRESGRPAAGPGGKGRAASARETTTGDEKDETNARSRDAA